MKYIARGGICVLLLVVLLGMTGCMPRGGVTNPGWTVVTTQDQVAYVALATGQVVALDATQSGAEIWTYPGQSSSGGGIGSLFRPTESDEPVETALNAVYGSPVLTDELVLLASFDGGIYALDRSTGKKVWEYSVPKAIIGGLTLRDGVAYFGCSDHNVYALDISTHQPVWSSPFVTGNWVWGVPAVSEDRVYVSSMDHYVYAIDRQTGAEVWKADVGASVPGGPTLTDGKVVVGGVDRRLHAYDADDGSLVWQTDVLGGWVWGEAVISDGYAYFASLDGAVHSASLDDGSPRWGAVSVKGAARSGPVILGDSLIVATEDAMVYEIDMATGDAREHSGAAGAVLSTPSVEDDIVYIATTTAKVQALNFAREVDPVVWTYPQNDK